MKTVILFVLLFFTLPWNLLSKSQNERVLQTTTYVTTPDRGATVQSQCSGSINRQSLYDTYGLNPDIAYSGSVQNAFKLNTSIIDLAIDGKWSDFGGQIKGQVGRIFVFVGAWVIGLGIALLLWPFLLCCCICPWSCPTCNRKRQNMPYENPQMVWPAIVTLILLLIILVTSIVGIASRFKFHKNQSEVACVSGVIVDDVTNGNVSFTNSSKFFIGVRTLDTELRDINDNINQLNSQIVRLGSSSPGMSDAKSKISTAKSSTAQIPSTSESSLSLTYKTPLQSIPGSTTGEIPSTFPTILGNKLEPNSLISKAWSTLVIYEIALNLIGGAADLYNQNAPSFTGYITKALQQTDRYATDLQQFDIKINDFWKKNNSYFKGATIGQYVYYGVLIGLTVLMIIAVSCTVFGMSQNCRYFMYTLCVLLFLMCIIAFALCIAVSILNPLVYYSCQYVQENLNSKAKLAITLSNRFNLDASISGNISDCISNDGAGNIAKNMLGEGVYTLIDSLNTTYLQLININTTEVTYISTIHGAVLQTVTGYKKAQIKDITDQTSLDQLIKLSKASSYSCSSNGFSSDSWIPAITQNSSYIPCQISGGSNADSSTCTSTINFNTRAQGCTGCMDTYDLFKGNSTYVNVNAALTSRYPDPTCVIFNSQLSNVWGNFYKTKLDVIGPVESRAQTAKTNADAVVGTITYFEDVKRNIETNFSAIVDIKYGVLAGIDCKTLSQDIYLVKNVVCQGLFAYTYFARVIFGIISFALLFLMCCVTCTGHRNVKQMEFGSRIDPYEKKQNSPKFQNNNMPSEQKFIYNKPTSTELTPYYQPQNPYVPSNQYKTNQFAYYP